jgi:hypothetical protein
MNTIYLLLATLLLVACINAHYHDEDDDDHRFSIFRWGRSQSKFYNEISGTMGDVFTITTSTSCLLLATLLLVAGIVAHDGFTVEGSNFDALFQILKYQEQCGRFSPSL